MSVFRQWDRVRFLGSWRHIPLPRYMLCIYRVFSGNNTLLWSFIPGFLCDILNRNLSGNPLLDLQTVNFTYHFPQLAVLDVSGLSSWLNASHVKKHLPRLQVIRGTPLDGQCLRCFLRKDISLTTNHGLFERAGLGNVAMEISNAIRPPIRHYKSCYGNILSFKDSYLRHYEAIGYNLSCLLRNTHICFTGCIKCPVQQMSYNMVSLNQCWDMMNKSSIFLVFLATVAIAMNVTVVIVTARSKPLRENVTQFLVSCVALGNLSMSLYVFVITSTRASISYQEMVQLIETTFCTFMGLLLMISLGVSALTSFVVSLERYLVIVYCMNPNIRISLCAAKKCVGLAFLMSCIFGILPFTVLAEFYTPDTHCIPIAIIGVTFECLIIPGAICVILYLLNVPMYIHMYICIRRASQAEWQWQCRENHKLHARSQ